MRLRRLAAVLLGASLPATALGAPKPGAAPLSRAAMVRALQRGHVLEGRHLDGVREVCRLRLDGGDYPVIATAERVTGIPEPRLYRHLVVLRPNLSKAYVLPYDFGVGPTRCGRDTVEFTGGLVSVDGEDGSVVQFANGAADAWIFKGGESSHP